MTRARFLATLLVVAVAAGCARDDGAPAAPSAPAAGSPAAAAPADAPLLVDVVESTPSTLVGISYPPSANRYPALAAEMKRFAEDARADLAEAATERKAEPGAPPYDLSLSFTEVYLSPTLVAYAAEGTSYTGGAHGAPLIARFVWLPRENRMLRATDLVPGDAGWRAVSAFVREQLRTALVQRLDADAADPAARAAMLRGAGELIDAGTEPDAANFALFEPIVRPDGKLTGLRFVFAPYQVGPYSDGTQTVEVPASVLRPHVAPAYRDLFVDG